MAAHQRPRQDVVDVMNGRFLGSRSFPAVPESVREGRRWLAGTLTSALGPGRAVCEDGVLLLSEGLTNAILHGGGDKVEVGVFIYGDCVRVEIFDEGGETVPHYVEDPSGERGRGLPIIQSLAREWGFERMDGGRLKV